ncbi:MAG: hypothetical protein J6M53_03955 [Bacteroidaceae bacterium]|nr:hypothetical protein [Bacteroidaceae bacterium]
MKSFSFPRFWQTLKWDLQTNRRTVVRHWLVMLTLFFFAILLPHACVITEGDRVHETYVTYDYINQAEYDALPAEEKASYEAQEAVFDDEGNTIQMYARERPNSVTPWAERVEEQHQVTALLLLVIVLVYLEIGASFFLSNMPRKQQGIAFLMLPASRGEKLLARWVYAVPLWTLMVLTAFVAGDLLRYAVQPLIGAYHPGLMTTWLWNQGGNLLGEIKTAWAEHPEMHSPTTGLLLFILAVQWWSHTCYLLGSAVFRRFSWIITTGLMWLLSSVASTVAFTFTTERYLVDIATSRPDSTGFNLTSVFFVLLGVTNLVLTWYVFKRAQVVQNKLTTL